MADPIVYFFKLCNYDNHFIRQIDLPPFYKEILLHMLELKQLYGYHQEDDLVLKVIEKF